jgi:hypothetical protein
VTSDHRSAETLPVYFQFRPPKNVKFVFAEDLASARTENVDKVILYTNDALSKYLVGTYHARDYGREFNRLHLKPLYSAQGWQVSVAGRSEVAELTRRIRH